MRKRITFILLILMVLSCLCGCTSGDKEEETGNRYDLAGKTYYNTVDEFGHEDHAKVWFGKDGSYVLNDSYEGGYYDISGSWSISENVCTLNVESSGQGSFSKIIFEIEDDDTLLLKTSLAGSRSDQTFSTSETKGSAVVSPVSPEENKPETPSVKEVPCTGLKSKYHNYWAVEGSKPWNLEVTASPKDTTDKISYKSNDENVVKVDENGNVSAIKPGKTTIDITCGDQKLSVGFETRSKSGGVTEIVLDSDKLITRLENHDPIGYKLLPESASDKTIQYQTADPSIAIIGSDNTVIGKKPGITKVTLTAASGVSATVDVCVEGSFLVAEMPDQLTLKGGSGDMLFFEVYKLKCEDWNVTKEDLRLGIDAIVSDPSLISVDNKGRIIADGSTVSSTKDVTVYFVWEDEDLFPEASTPIYTIHVTP